MEELLRQATAVAEAANRAKSRFLADMSHELRTPLNSILGFGQLMELQGAEGLSDKQREYLRWIREGGEHLLDMVNDVLDLSKVEAGKVELEKSGIDPALLIRRVLTTVRTLAAKKHLHIVISVGSDLGVLDADEVRIKQVLYNLLSNAIKFTAAEKRIGVEARAEAGTLVLRVWDEGMGIPAGDLPRIFEPYMQSRSSRTGEGNGPRACHREAPRGAARRHRLRGKHRGQGQQLHRPDSRAAPGPGARGDRGRRRGCEGPTKSRTSPGRPRSWWTTARPTGR